MQRRRQQKDKQAHFCLLVNEQATGYDPEPIRHLTAAIKQRGGHFTVLRPSSATDLLRAAQAACGYRKGRAALPNQFDRHGKVTGLVACGGDGTFNLVARAAIEANLPVGALPMGRFNNIAASLWGPMTTKAAVEKIINRGYHKIDSGVVANQLFFGSIGLGLVPYMAQLLESKKTPRFSLGWSRLGSRAAVAVGEKKTIIKVDAFRFEIRPVILNINLLPYTLGLPLTPASLFDDSRAEVVFDVGDKTKEIPSFLRQISKRKYSYGTDVRLFRGSVITLQPVRARTLYLDGELVSLSDSVVDVHIGEKRLKVFW